MIACRLEKRVPEKNQYRFYRLELQPSLFNEWSVIREWGRIGCQGRLVIETYDSFIAADLALNAKIAEKHRRGYDSV